VVAVAKARWLSIRVELVSGPTEDPGAPPGRIMIASPKHTLSDFADAINLAFARWDLSHVHMFEFGDDRYMPDGDELEDDFLDSAGVTLGSLGLTVGSEFVYVFDLGDNWTHRCRIEATDLDPNEAYGVTPGKPAPIWGWGWIPDQYGRVADDEAEEE
jgi:hypothetical protein